jgi:hypothetical protein
MIAKKMRKKMSNEEKGVMENLNCRRNFCRFKGQIPDCENTDRIKCIV